MQKLWGLRELAHVRDVLLMPVSISASTPALEAAWELAVSSWLYKLVCTGMNLIPKILIAVDACSHFGHHQGPPGTWVDEADASYQLSQSFACLQFIRLVRNSRVSTSNFSPCWPLLPAASGMVPAGAAAALTAPGEAESEVSECRAMSKR